MSAIGKHPPANLFEKAPGGKKEKQYILDPGTGGVMTQSREIKKATRQVFPKPETVLLPPGIEPDPLPILMTSRDTGGKRKLRGRGRLANILAGRLMQPSRSRGTHILGSY